MMRTLRFMLVAALALVCGKSFAVETVTWSASSGSALTTIAVDDNITLTWAEGGGDHAPRYNGSVVYFYNGNHLSVAAASGKMLTKIVFAFGEGSYSLVTCDNSGKNESSTGITTSSDDKTCTWSGEASSLVFRAARQTGVRYIKSITVTYKGENETVEQVADLSITGANINSTVDLDNGGSIFVNYKNLGDAAKNAVLSLYVDGTVNNSVELGTVDAGRSTFATISYNAATIEAGDHQVYVAISADNDGGEGVKQSAATTVTFTKKAPEATFTLAVDDVTVAWDATSYDVVAHVTNTSEVDATGVVVQLYSGSSVVASTTVDVAAGQTADATLTVGNGPFAAGEKEMQVVVANKVGKWIKVIVEEEPVAEVKDLAITEVLGTIKLADETSYVRVTVQNNGNVTVTDAPVVLKAGEQTLGQGTVSAVAGQAGFCQIAVATAGLEAGELAVVATVTVEGDATPADNTLAAKLTVEAAPAPEATYSVTAENVLVAYGDTQFSIVAAVKNTSDIDAAGVEVKLLKGATEVETKTIETLAAGAETTVTFTIAATEEAPFVAGTTARYYVQVANKAQDEVVVTFEEEPVAEVKDLAITAVQGTIDLAETTSNVTVIVANNGNVDITDAPVVLTAGDNELGSATVSAKAGETGWCQIAVSTEGLEAGTLSVVATVTVEGDATAADNTLSAELTVKAVAVPEATFEVTAEDVAVEYGAESFQIVAVVKNTSEVDATDVEVKLLKGASEVEAKTIETLTAGAETTVTFTIAATEEAPFVAGTTASYYVQVANQAQADVTVSFEEEPVAEVSDLAITEVSGNFYLDVETNYISVSVQNNGTVDIRDAAVTVKTAGGSELGTGTISAKAGDTGFCSVVVSTEGMEAGTLDIVVEVEVEGDATPEDNKMEKTVTIYENSTDGIRGVQNQPISSAYTCYDLSGRQIAVGNSVNGKSVNGKSVNGKSIYIINGKKVVLK